MIFLTERFFIYLNILFKNYNKKNTLKFKINFFLILINHQINIFIKFIFGNKLVNKYKYIYFLFYIF